MEIIITTKYSFIAIYTGLLSVIIKRRSLYCHINVKNYNYNDNYVYISIF